MLLATGLRDVIPTCAGFRDFYGSSAYHCPDCDGYEVSGKRVAVLGHGENIIGFTLDFLTWTDKLTLLTDEHSLETNQESIARLALHIRSESKNRLSKVMSNAARYIESVLHRRPALSAMLSFLIWHRAGEPPA